MIISVLKAIVGAMNSGGHDYHFDHGKKGFLNLVEDEADFPGVLYDTLSTLGLNVTMSGYVGELEKPILSFLFKSELDWTHEQHEVNCLNPARLAIREFITLCQNSDSMIDSITIIGDATPLINVFDTNASGFLVPFEIKLKTELSICVPQVPPLPNTCEVGSIVNSNSTFADTVASGGIKTLNDITWFDSDGEEKTAPAQTVITCTPSSALGTLLRRPEYSYQNSSSAVFDERDQFNKGWFNFIDPVNPVFVQALDLSTDITGRTLLHNNSFGNKFRYTTVLGSQATAIKGQLVIDNYTGLMILDDRDLAVNEVIWNSAFGVGGRLDQLNVANFQGHNDWIFAPIRVVGQELNTINAITNRSFMLPWMSTQSLNICSSSSHNQNTNFALIYTSQGLLTITGKGGICIFMLCRKHF